MNYLNTVNYIKMINDIKRDLNLLKDFDIRHEYQNGLGFICSSPFFVDYYIIITLSMDGYQIKTFRNGLIDEVYREKKYFTYSLIHDIISIINKEILYDFT